MLFHKYVHASPFVHTDIISALKSGDSPVGNVGSVDTSLSPNDLSNSTSAVVPVDRRLRDEEPQIFSKLPPGKFGPQGENLCSCVMYSLNTYTPKMQYVCTYT